MEQNTLKGTHPLVLTSYYFKTLCILKNNTTLTVISNSSYCYYTFRPISGYCQVDVQLNFISVKKMPDSEIIFSF